MSKHHENKDNTSHISRNDLQKEIVGFQLLLNEYKISFSDLSNSSPREAEIRHNAVNIAKIISVNVELKALLQKKKKLPIKELQKLLPICPKTLRKYNIYFMALALIFIGGFTLLMDYLNPQ
jgi:RNA polymerase sigma factor